MSNIELGKNCYFLANKYQLSNVRLANALSTEFWNIQRELNRIRKFPDKKTNLLKQEFVPPLPKQSDDTRPKKPSDVINGSIKKEHVDQLKSELEEARDLEIY